MRAGNLQNFMMRWQQQYSTYSKKDYFHGRLCEDTQYCDICGWNLEDEYERLNGRMPSGKKLVVDHDHATDLIRGLLCSTCNTGLGCFKDDPKLFRKAIKYLKDNHSTP